MFYIQTSLYGAFVLNKIRPACHQYVQVNYASYKNDIYKPFSGYHRVTFYQIFGLHSFRAVFLYTHTPVEESHRHYYTFNVHLDQFPITRMQFNRKFAKVA